MAQQKAFKIILAKSNFESSINFDFVVRYKSKNVHFLIDGSLTTYQSVFIFETLKEVDISSFWTDIVFKLYLLGVKVIFKHAYTVFYLIYYF